MAPYVHAGLALASLGVLSACSGSRLYTDEDPRADFDAYATYGFAPQLGTDTDGYGSLLSEFLKAAAGRELEARGYTLAAVPDLLVNFGLQTREQPSSTQTAVGYYGYRTYGTWSGYPAYATRVAQYTEGTLNVDLLDLRRGHLVWEGTLIGRLSEDMRRDLRSAVDQAMAEVFEGFPHVAGKRPLPPIESALDAQALLPLAEQGFAVAQMNLALLYLRGEGVEKSLEQAAQWMRRAAQQGFAKAQAKLGAMYEHGRGVPSDLIAAYTWSHLAAERGDPIGIEQRDALAQQLSVEQVAEAEQRAREWWPSEGRPAQSSR